MSNRPAVVRDAALDWVKFDAELSRDGSVDPVDKALYAALASFVDQGNREADDDPDSDEVPTRKRLAACIGRSVDTVDRATKRLEERGLLDVERRQDPDNPRRNIPSVYRLLDGERWDERAAERAAKRKADRARRKADTTQPQAEGGGRMSAARVAAPVRPGWPHECGGSSSPKSQEEVPPSFPPSESSAELHERPGGEDENPPTETADSEALRRAESVVSDAVRRWPSQHRAPGPKDRQRLAERVAAELAAGGDERTVLDELTRDLSDAGSAVRVLLGSRTKTPGWGVPADPRPTADRYEPTGPRPAWCTRCDERTRLVVAMTDDGGERMRRCSTCHPEASAVLQEPTEVDERELDNGVLDAMRASMVGAPAPTESGGLSEGARTAAAAARERLAALQRQP